MKADWLGKSIVACGLSLLGLGITGCGSKKSKDLAEAPPTLSAPVRPQVSEGSYSSTTTSQPSSSQGEFSFIQERQANPNEAQPLPKVRVEPVQVPQATPQPAATPRPVNQPPRFDDTSDRVYVMQKGDTLYGVARKYGVPPKELIAVNNFRNPNQIHVGAKVRIP